MSEVRLRAHFVRAIQLTRALLAARIGVLAARRAISW
jgi:hypothetical protein